MTRQTFFLECFFPLTHHHCYVVPLCLLDGPPSPEDELVGGQEGLQVAWVEGERAPGGGHAAVAELQVERGNVQYHYSFCGETKEQREE